MPTCLPERSPSRASALASSGDASFEQAQQPCPCGTSKTYVSCCGPWHRGERRLQAPCALTLMRSRYTAYVMDMLDYLVDTWHPATRPAKLESNPQGLKWLGLDVRRHVKTDDTHAIVEFVARSRLHGRGQRMHVTSRFVREDGRWYYVDDEPATDGGWSAKTA